MRWKRHNALPMRQSMTLLKRMFRWKLPYPKGIFTRFFLMLVLPMLVTQAVAVYIFYNRHWDSVSRHMMLGLSGEISALAEAASQLDGTPGPALRFAKMRDRLYLDASVIPESLADSGNIPADHRRYMAGRPLEALQAALDRATPLYPYRLINTEHDVMIVMTLPSDTVLRVHVSDKRISNPSTYIFVLWMSGAGIVTACIAMIFMRNQLRAVTLLADAMREYGRGGRAERYKPFGAREVRQAGEAFIRMRRRIDRFVRNRTNMLTGISHDLKTPITRMKLQLALLPEGQDIDAMNTDLDEMRDMIDMYLSYLRDEEHHAALPSGQTDMHQCIADTLAKFPAGDTVIKYHPYEAGILTVRVPPLQMKRVLENCLQNALKYGNGVVRVRLFATKRYAVLCVEDNGEGVRHDLRDAVFRPFTRTPRGQSKAEGSGLGLAIVKDIIKSAGGGVKMERSAELGGARCKINLPLSDEEPT